MKLQYKILLPIILLIVILLGISSYLSYSQASDTLRAQTHSALYGEARGLVRSSDQYSRFLSENIERLASTPEVVEALSKGYLDEEALNNLKRRMKATADAFKEFDVVTIINEHGQRVASSDEALQHEPDVSREQFFQTAIRGTLFKSSFYYDERRKVPAMLVAAPVKNSSGRIIGIVANLVNIDVYIQSIVAPVSVGSDGYAYMLNQQGTVVATKFSDTMFNEALGQRDTYKSIASKATDKPQIEYYQRFDGRNYVAAYVKSPFEGITTVVCADLDDIFSELSVMLKTSLMVALGAIITGAIVVFVLVRPIVGALDKGVSFAKEIANGNFDGQLVINRKDEIGQLAEALKTIPEVLKSIVTEYNTLEERIENGDLSSQGDVSRFKGAFAQIITGTNGIITRFRNVIDQIPSSVVILDKNMRATFINSQARSLAGEDYKGKTCSELFAREDYGTPKCALQKAVDSMHPASAETKARPKDREMDISYTAIPLTNREGKLSAVLQLVTDLTQIKSTQRVIVEVANEATDISNRVAAASEELSARIDDVNQGTDVQRDRVSSTATAMEEMNSTVLEVARSAGQASEQAEATRAKAHEGSSLVEQVISAIKQVNDVANELQQNMEDLSSQAEAIGGVMNVISDIADQTNLLALNAAIEAARAGEAGRGFAVVADEVRKLAEKTMSATTEVGSSIRGIQTSTSINKERVGQASARVGDATELAATSGKALSEILAFANTTSSLIASIATAAEEQSATSDEINHSIEEVNRIASDTSRGMGESALAVHELSDMAQELKVLLDRLQ